MKDISRKHATILLVTIIAISFSFHLSYINTDVQGAHAWRQCLTMWNINNFARYDANILNPRVSHFNGIGPENLHRYEFPLMQWIIGITMRLFGESIIIMRLYMFAFSALGIIGFYRLSSFFVKKRNTRVLTSFFIGFGPVYYYYSICPLPDVLALSSSIWYLYFIIKYFENPNTKTLLLASVSLMIATLVKLPYIMFSIVSIVYFLNSIWNNKSLELINIRQSVFQLLFLIPAILWYLWVIPSWKGNSIIQGIFGLDLSFYEILKILSFNLGELVPMALLYPMVWLFFIYGLIKLHTSKATRQYLGSIFFITMFYFAFEFNVIKVYHDYYLMPFIVWLYLIVAIGLEYFLLRTTKWKKIILIFLISSAPIFAFLSSQKKYSVQGYYTLHDAVIHRDSLRNAAPRDELCMIISDVSNYIFSYQIDKRGYVFQNENVPLSWVNDMIMNKDVKYCYSNSRHFDENPLFLNYYVSKKVLRVGSINVFKFKTIEEILLMESVLKRAAYYNCAFLYQ